jgi:hypothetical protein
MIKTLVFLVGVFLSLSTHAQPLQYGVRPHFLIDAMVDSPLKSKLPRHLRFISIWKVPPKMV